MKFGTIWHGPGRSFREEIDTQQWKNSRGGVGMMGELDDGRVGDVKI